MIANVDAGQLRRALRVIHCLQRERGASGAYCASDYGIAISEGSRMMPLTTARVDTDRALEHMKGHAESRLKISTTMLTLQKIRSMIDRREETVPSFRRILVSFSTLISAVIHEFVLRYTVASLNNSQANNGNAIPLLRTKSSDNIKRQAGKPSHRRLHSAGNEAHVGICSRPLMQHSSSAPAHVLSVDKTPLPSSKISPLLDPFPQIDSDDQEESPEFGEETLIRLKQLLSLLGIFVQLKESTGVVRATLTSMLVFQQQDASLMLNDVVLEVENQRRQLEALRIQVRPGPLRNLVLELTTMNPDMQQVQESLLRGYSLDGFLEHYNADKLWDVMTVYIDKLHSLELLIVEEMEATKDRVDVQTPNLSVVWKRAFEGDTVEDLLQSIEGLSANEVKKRLVASLRKEQKEPSVRDKALEARAKRGVDDLLQELCNAPASKEWEIDIYELRFLKRIGQGSAGTTYLAEWSGLKVGVKVASITEMGLEGWRTEVESLQKLHHPNIIRLLGSVYHPHPLTFCLVLEYCDAGDLQTALCKVTPRNFFFHVSTSIAKGMAYLHNRSIIHRDIKPSNVLLHGDIASGQYQVKVTDFGVATDLNSSRNRTAETGTYRWMSPEVIRHENYSQTADVYSYAILLWQLVTREEPFADKGQIEAAVSVSMESARPPLPDGTPEALANLLKKAWADCPQDRPSFEEITELLTDLESGLSEDEKRWLEAPLGHPYYKLQQEQEGVEINELDLKLPGNRQIPKVNNLKAAKKRGMRFALFSRKSSHF